VNHARAKAITRERLAEWSRLTSLRIATPAVLVSVSHAPDSLGALVVCTVKDMPGDRIASLLRRTADEIERRGRSP